MMNYGRLMTPLKLRNVYAEIIAFWEQVDDRFIDNYHMLEYAGFAMNRREIQEENWPKYHHNRGYLKSDVLDYLLNRGGAPRSDKANAIRLHFYYKAEAKLKHIQRSLKNEIRVND